MYFETSCAVVHEKGQLEATGFVPADYGQRVIIAVNNLAYQGAELAATVQIVQVSHCMRVFVSMDFGKIVFCTIFFDPTQFRNHVS
jgi:hypothetical protein